MALGSLLYRIVCTFVLAVPALAGGVHNLSTPGAEPFRDLQSAIDAAFDGDVLLVGPDRYPAFVIDGKALTLVCTESRGAVIDGGIEIRNVQGTVVLAGFFVRGQAGYPAGEEGLFVFNNAGHVRFHDCSFIGGDGTDEDYYVYGSGGPGARIGASPRVAFVRCSLRGGEGFGECCSNYYGQGGNGGHGVVSVTSAVSLYDCNLSGGSGGEAGSYGGDGGHAYELPSWGIFASGSTFSGGGGGDAWDFIFAKAGDGGHGIHVENAQAQLLDNVYIGGPGGDSLVFPSCDGVPGEGIAGGGVVQLFDGDRRKLSAAPFASDTRDWPVTIEGTPGDRVVLLFANQPAFFFQQSLKGTWLIPPAAWLPAAPLAIVPPSGVLTVQVELPDFPGPGVARPFFLQGYVIDDQGEPLLASPLHLVVLDRAGAPDCTGNGVLDFLDVTEGTEPDCDDNLVPDPCDPDCNGNSVVDGCDIKNGTSDDCNVNGVPDECDISDGTSADCNENSIPDECDIANGTSQDVNNNGIPDECETQKGLTFWVDASAPPGGDGSQASPFQTVGQGISATFPGDTVIVRDGLYVGPENRDLGFAGKDIVLRSENGAANCILDAQGLSRVFHFKNGETSAARVEGLTIRGGFVTQSAGTEEASTGGGLRLNFAQPTIVDCVIEGNFANRAGGGLWYRGSGELRVEGCVFDSNETDLDHILFGLGGGLYSEGTVEIVRCEFRGNAARVGGGVHLRGSNVPYFVTHSRFESNAATHQGAGLYSLTHAAAGVLNVAIDNCLFAANVADTQGGGVYLRKSQSQTAADVLITNTTLADNQAGQAGGGAYVFNNKATFANCILWNSVAPSGADLQLNQATSKAFVDYCDLLGGETGVGGAGTLNWGAGNLDLDPLFTLPSYDLGFGSPCADAGDNASIPADTTDVDGDGDTGEPVPLDLDLGVRRVDDPDAPDTGNGTAPLVDMGALERP